MAETKNLLTKLMQVQQDLKAPKNQFNSFGKYKYRSCEDILQAARPLCNANGLVITMSDAVEAVGARFYIKATVTVTDVDTGESFSTHAMAREEDSKKGMDAAQVTGAASSYARKYSLCAMFAIDDTKDADTDEYSQTPQNRAGDAKSKKPSVPMQGIQKGKDSEFLRGQALKKVQNVQKFENITNEQVKAVISWKFGKNNWKELNLDEACMLADMLPKYIKEMEAA